MGILTRWIAIAFVFLVSNRADAVPLNPVAGGSLAGIPAAQFLATMTILGEWPLLSGGQVRLQSVLTRNGGECGVGGEDDANICGRFTLLVSANGETAVPVDFTLFRAPETLGWTVPKDATPTSDYGKFSLPLSACEMKKTATGYGWKGTSYILRVTETLSDSGHYLFTANLDKLPGERPDCSQ